MKKVSVIVPCYNQAQYLPETLQSVLDQTCPYWECIIVNDGSTDHSEEVAKSFCKKDSRFHYFYKDNTGLADTRNFAILHCSGDFILPLDSDDLISEDYIEEAMKIFDKNPDVTLVYPEVQLFGDKNEKWNLANYSYQEILYNNMIVCSAIYKREDWLKTNGYNPNMIYGLEDWDFWLTLLHKDSVVIRLDKIHFFYRIRNDSMTRTADQEHFNQSYMQLFLNHQDLYLKNLNPVADRRLIIDYKKIIQYHRLKRKKYQLLYQIMLTVSITLFIALLLVVIL